MTAIREVIQTTANAQRAEDIAARVISDRAEGEAYVASVCFKHGPPSRFGVELEYTVHYQDDPGRDLDPTDLTEALGPHSPRTLRPHSPAVPLPHGSSMTVEPGGQVEISTLPQRSLQALATAADGDLGYVSDRLARHGLVLGASGTDPHRRPLRVLDTKRYAAMERRFSRIGPDGLTMMCATAALQVCVDAGPRSALAARWAALHAIGPVLLALFANSRRLSGVDTGLASARWRAVMGTEPSRTAPTDLVADPVGSWSERVLNTPLMVVRHDAGEWDAPANLMFGEWIDGKGVARKLRRPSFADLDYHLTTMFTPVRPRGYLEVRYLDAQPSQDWLAPVALLCALLAKESTVDAALDLCTPVIGCWQDAVRHGLDDPRLARAARAVVELGCGSIPDLDLDRYTTAQVITRVHARLRANSKEAR